jgi:NAD(P)-dependent dehydrogenase (short-subunit alcohol dehydrogenase family)
MQSWQLRERAAEILSKEVGYVSKPHGGRLRVALAFPNTYFVGMSNLGFQTVYSLFNAEDGIVCERTFLPPKSEVEALVAGTVQQYGGVDILVCNAAVNPYYGPLAGISDEAFDKIMASNIKSNLWLCNLAIPNMVSRGGGSVVIISSIGGIRGTEVLGAYGISKAADFALARNLACEWGPKNVRVNCIAPGLVKTDFARALWENEEMVKRRNAQTPLRRIGMPDEIGGVAAFLAGPAASFITGQVIVADGGVTIS